MKKQNLFSFWKDCYSYLLGGSLFAASVNIFTAPANIAPGGATGIATVLNHLFSLPIGSTIFLLNLPLFLFAGYFLGWRTLPKTITATALSSLLIDFWAVLLPVYTGSRLLAALYGGVFAGLGIAFIFLRGGTTGGTDLAAKLLKKAFPRRTLGQLILGLDSIIILASAVIYKDVDSGLYACIVIFVTTTIIDKVLYQEDMGKILYIISERPTKVANAILHTLSRGVTLLQGKGGYSGNKKQVVFCVLRRGEVWRAKQLIKEIDPSAFVIVTDAGQVMGEGFSPMG